MPVTYFGTPAATKREHVGDWGSPASRQWGHVMVARQAIMQATDDDARAQAEHDMMMAFYLWGLIYATPGAGKRWFDNPDVAQPPAPPIMEILF